MYIANENRYEKMKFNKVGNSGLRLPAVSLGFWHNFGDKDNYSTMEEMCFTAFDNGITHFDLANNYGPKAGSAEKNFGRIFKEHFKPYRDEMIISTKAGYAMWAGPYGDGGSRKYLLASIDQSLERLGLDYVDIFYHHRMDPETSLEETMSALDQIAKSGKALYIGLSNYDGPTLKKASEILNDLKTPFIINQNCYNILNRTIENNGLKAASAKLGKGIICFSPLAQGLLSDRYLQDIPEDSRIKKDGRFLKEENVKDKHEILLKLNEIATARNQTLAEMALAWILKDSDITSVLVGASRPTQILDNIKAIENTSFSKEELKAIDSLTLRRN